MKVLHHANTNDSAAVKFTLFYREDDCRLLRRLSPL